ncbi:FAD-dependent oxidoreductase [Pseudoroseomonas wenyumeiae]|uniref:FAD-dependent oxidoreductase n=1 Tax=Teichococcus wenyumeiae TaxID=2478470 RepID=A0A3A9JM34_9PROT|nr:NAD(P)/FAD-dependent oxidoreductase [Pseudoroseomonas wenyumeiae]RKK04876.1 NAD(P)/FAD-dependent oxidoreductase [Pseudoroseomonas wenyumeiae]RMI25009.1 FAD-dependent oxidoreductase [Pseudoroseomonas wenyumeiae]
MPLDSISDAGILAERCDVLIVGGGPAGSTAAALLAAQGRKVVMLEKEVHPRFHIGESLLPQNLRIFEKLGVAEQVQALGVFKPGASFISDEHGAKVSFSFADGINKNYTHSYQVKRAEFDELLFRNAAARGAETHEGTRVLDVALDPVHGSRVTARDASGATRTWLARFVIDASGRDTLLAGQQGGKQRNPHNNTAALYGHFRGVTPCEGCHEGNITIHLLPQGWCWMIPLPGGITSVGIVSTPEFFKTRKGAFEPFLMESLRQSPSIRERMEQAELVSPVTTTGNYSYRATEMVGEGWMMVGDAFAFIDPVFSSGVMLAMASAELGAEAVDAWLDDPARAAPLMRTFERKVKRAIASMSWLIYRINRPVLRDMFMQPSNRFRMRDGLVSLLAGDVHANTNRQLPVLAFKATYGVLSVAHRLGYRLRGGTLRKVESAPLPA